MVSVTLKASASCATGSCAADGLLCSVCTVFSLAKTWPENAIVNKLKHNTSKDLIVLDAIVISKFAAKIGIKLLKSHNI
jgi:hypothetical protein